MKISIVIPAFNEARLLPATLRAVNRAREAFHSRAWDSELIVCDNNSTDTTGALAREAGALVVFEPINQIGRARNTGAAAATGDWLIFVDADSEPTAELFAEVARRIESRRVLAGGALVAMDHGPRWVHVGAWVWGLYSSVARHMAGAFIFVETAAFREIDGFNIQYFAGEELDLSRRLKNLAKRRGLKIEIIRSPPLRTSARKASLYTPRETLRLLARALWQPRRTLTRREECAFWYDGRR